MASDQQYMQSEKMRGGRSMMGGKPSGGLAIIASLEKSKPGDSSQSKGPDALKAAGYTGPEERCSGCDHFNEARERCEMYKVPADPMGHCDSFETRDGEGADHEDGEGGDEEYTEHQPGGGEYGQ